MKKDSIIKLNPNFNIKLNDEIHNSILIVGNFYGFFGDPDEEGFLPNLSKCSKEIVDMIIWMFIKNKDAKHVFIGTYDKVGKYLRNLRKTVTNLFGINIKEDNWIEYLVKEDSDQLNILNKVKEEMPKFDYIIQNPPYSKTLHIDFFKKGIEMLSDDGKMTIIEPATWLINLRNNEGKGKTLYTPFKKGIQYLIESIKIENLNEMFGIGQLVPCSITKINKNKNKKNPDINISLFGFNYKTNNINDVNYIKSFNLFRNIIDKIQNNCKDYPKLHITNTICNNKKYIRYSEILSHTLVTNGLRESGWLNDIFAYYIYPSVKGSVLDNIPMTLNNGGKETNKPSKCLYGSQEELTNWKHFCENNTLPLFINICMTINQNNNSLKYVPWLVDKQYTDQEIYDMFKFTQKEINLIEKTVKKFKRNTPWTQRMIYGPTKVSDQEVQEFCDKLDKEYPTD